MTSDLEYNSVRKKPKTYEKDIGVITAQIRLLYAHNPPYDNKDNVYPPGQGASIFNVMPGDIVYTYVGEENITPTTSSSRNLHNLGQGFPYINGMERERSIAIAGVAMTQWIASSAAKPGLITIAVRGKQNIRLDSLQPIKAWEPIAIRLPKHILSYDGIGRWEQSPGHKNEFGRLTPVMYPVSTTRSTMNETTNGITNAMSNVCEGIGLFLADQPNNSAGLGDWLKEMVEAFSTSAAILDHIDAATDPTNKTDMFSVKTTGRILAEDLFDVYLENCDDGNVKAYETTALLLAYLNHMMVTNLATNNVFEGGAATYTAQHCKLMEQAMVFSAMFSRENDIHTHHHLLGMALESGHPGSVINVLLGRY